MRRYSRSVKKFIRSEKAKIRRNFSDTQEAEQKIKELLGRFKPSTKK